MWYAASSCTFQGGGERIVLDMGDEPIMVYIKGLLRRLALSLEIVTSAASLNISSICGVSPENSISGTWAG